METCSTRKLAVCYQFKHITKNKFNVPELALQCILLQKSLPKYSSSHKYNYKVSTVQGECKYDHPNKREDVYN